MTRQSAKRYVFLLLPEMGILIVLDTSASIGGNYYEVDSPEEIPSIIFEEQFLITDLYGFYTDRF